MERKLLSRPDIALMNFERADAYLRRNSLFSELLLLKGTVDLAQNLPFSPGNLLDGLKIMLLSLLTLFYPLFKILPPAYRWRMRSKADRCYKELQSVGDRMRLGEIS